MIVKTMRSKCRRAAVLGAVVASLVATSAVAQVAFTKVSLPGTNGRKYTGIAIGPDGKLYAADLSGNIVRYPINLDSTLGTAEVLTPIITANGGARAIIAITFDPAATAGNLILWVTHSGAPLSGSPDWLGKITRLSGPNLATVQDYVVNLPRSTRDHMTNGLVFHPGEPGVIYVEQGSNSAMGAPDAGWGNRSERALSAAVLRVELSLITSPPLDVKTAEGGTYDPWAPGAPVTVFGSGIRNCYDLVWHTNGQLYVPCNGSAGGGNTPGTPSPLPSACSTRRMDLSINGPYTGPAVPGNTNVSTQNEYLFRVVDGGTYGHPNPERCEWVMNGGNPTAGTDPAQVIEYPVGTQPDRNWRGAAYDFGKNWSPNGILEYRSTAFGGALQGKLIVVRYSGGDDLIVLTPGGPNLDIVNAQSGLTGMTGFVDPLDIVENVSRGDLYVTEHGAQRITLLKPQTPPTGCITAGDCSGTLPDCGQFACIASICEVVPVSAGPVCRTAAGECDAQEICNGASTLCPSDVKKANGTACSSDGNPCSLDQCNGSSNSCQHPAGNPGATCRAAVPGGCDVAESCTGGSTTCPADGYAAGGTLCRAATGDCDVAELCTGIGATCPANGFVGAGNACGDPSDTVCTDPDQCDGSGTCLANNAANGSACGDQGVECQNDDSCQSGVCQDAGSTSAGTACTSDGDICTDDICDGGGSCTHVLDVSNDPSCLGATTTTTLPAGCAETVEATVQTKKSQVKLSTKPESDKVKTGGELLLSEGDSFDASSEDVTVTLRDASGDYFTATIPAGSFIGSSNGRSYKFKDKLLVNNGMRTAKLSVGKDGRTVRYKFSVQRRDLPAFETGVGGVTIQLGSSCYSDTEDTCLIKGSGVQCR